MPHPERPGTEPPQLLAGGAAAAVAACDGCPSPTAAGKGTLLVSKVLTYSDVSTDVARTGRIVLPRIQVQQCLPELLQLCGAGHALPALRAGGPVKLSVDLAVEDEAGRPWVLLLKTWQNVVSGEHRPTFVLENTADFVRAHRLVQGGTLAFCTRGAGMLLRTSLRPDQLLPRNRKRGAAGASSPAAKRRAAPAARSPPAACTPEPPAIGSHGRRTAVPAPAGPSPAFWQPSPANAAEAAAALLHMHSPGSSASDQEAPGRGSPASPVASTGATAAAACTAQPRSSSRGPDGSHPASPATLDARHLPHPVHRPAPRRACHVPQPVWQQQQQQQQQLQQVEVPSQPAIAAAAAAALPGAQHAKAGLFLPPVHPLGAAVVPPPQPGLVLTATAALPPGVLSQVHAWLAAVVVQQERERRALQLCNRLLLLRAVQQQHQQQQRRQQQNALAVPHV